MNELVSYQFIDGVAFITMDDGKVNVLSPAMLDQLNRALDQAESDQAVVVLAGREGMFSGGFDLKVMRSGPDAASAMLAAGFALAERMYSFRAPIVIACTGHSVAMGAFLCLSADYRVGIDGPFKIVINEVAIGMTLPKGTIEISRYRLSPSHFTRATTLAETFMGAEAVAAGFFDRVVPQSELLEHAESYARELTKLHRPSFIATKMRVRAEGLTAIRHGFEADALERQELFRS